MISKIFNSVSRIRPSRSGLKQLLPKSLALKKTFFLTSTVLSTGLYNHFHQSTACRKNLISCNSSAHSTACGMLSSLMVAM